MTIRILRIIEYIYENAAVAEYDMARWQVPAIGTKRFGSDETIKSTILTDLNFVEDSDE